MENKRQIIFLIIGTLFFSFFIYGLASRDYTEKKTRYAFNSHTLTETNVYKKPDLNSKIIGTLPANTNIRIGKESKYFYQVVKAEDQASVKGGYLPKEAVQKAK